MGKKGSCPISMHLVKDELSTASDLLAAQVAAGLPRAETLDSLFKSSVDHLKKVGRDIIASECIELMTLANGGPWTSEQKRELAIVIGGMKGGQISATDGTASTDKHVKNQNCLFIENMIPEQSWADLRAKSSSLLARAHVLAQVACSINLVNPSQPTLFRMTSILAYCNDRDWSMSQEQVFSFMDKIKAFIKAGRPKSTEAVYLVDYPVAAKDLPASLQKLAFGDGDLPVEVNIPELDQILAGMKQRGRDKLKEPPWLQHVPLEYRSMVTLQMKKQTCSTPCEPELPMPSDMADTVQKIRSGMLPAPFLKREPGVAPSASQHSACSHLFPHVKAENVKKEEKTDDDDESGKAAHVGKSELEDMEKAMSEAAVARAKGKPNKKKAKDNWDAKLKIVS